MNKNSIIGMSLLALIACNTNEEKNKVTETYNSVSKQDFPALQKSIDRGKIVYNKRCVTCHLDDGKGVSRIFPPLANSDFLRKNQTESIKAAKHGLSGKIRVNNSDYNSVMSPLGLSDKDVADVINYINNSWGNKIDNFVTPEKVSEL